MENSGRPTRVLYFGVRDTGYPRNERVRRYLERNANCVVTVSKAPAGGSRLSRYWSQARAALTLPSDYDVVVLSEFSLNYFLFSWIMAKRSRATHIVDFFVGLHETEVGDSGDTDEKSVRARILRAIDYGAVMSASYCLTDTDVRSARFASLNGERRDFVTLPVGAPDWAVSGSDSHVTIPADRPLGVLYYGSYLALHGLPNFVDALSRLDARNLDVTMIGNGPLRSQIELRVSELGLEGVVRFVDPVHTDALAQYIERADVIVGIFGSSSKASEVIANKVWQGLYMGKIVVTRESPALAEIAEPAGSALVRVEDGAPTDIAAALTRLLTSRNEIRERDTRATRAALEAYVGSRFEAAFSRPPLNQDFRMVPSGE
jgi:glycosyltransferase involved in cell wall biosynthesis